MHHMLQPTPHISHAKAAAVHTAEVVAGAWVQKVQVCTHTLQGTCLAPYTCPVHHMLQSTTPISHAKAAAVRTAEFVAGNALDVLPRFCSTHHQISAPITGLITKANTLFPQVLPWMFYRDEAARITKANTQVAAASERELARVRTAILQVRGCVPLADKLGSMADVMYAVRRLPCQFDPAQGGVCQCIDEHTLDASKMQNSIPLPLLCLPAAARGGVPVHRPARAARDGPVCEQGCPPGCSRD
eukprot:1157322-Pelagomonas_calceolata.AAC.6